MSAEAILHFRSLADAAAPADELPAGRSPAQARIDTATFDDVSDESLLVAVGRGSKDAVSCLFRRHATTVFNVAQKILRDEAEAADLRQEVFLYIFERAKLYDPGKSSARSWIIQITYHRAFDRRRFLTARQHYKVEELDEQRVQSHASNLSIDQLDARCILERLKGDLTPEQYETLELHFFQGYSFQEIAQRHGQAVGNIRHHYYRGLDRLRSNLFPKKRR